MITSTIKGCIPYSGGGRTLNHSRMRSALHLDRQNKSVSDECHLNRLGRKSQNSLLSVTADCWQLLLHEPNLEIYLWIVGENYVRG